MKVFIIAQIMDNKKVVGYRLLDVEDHNKIKDCNIQTIKKVLSTSKDESLIKNAALVNGEIVGTNGQLSRYPKITTRGQLVNVNESPLIVINKIENLGYTVSDFKGTVIKMKTSDVVNYAKNQGIANGKVVVQDNVEYISSISDTYEQIKIAPSKVGAGSRVNINIPMGGDSREIAKHTKNEINTELQYNDVFSAMSKEQRDVLTQYYTWYTVDVYKSLAKNVRLSLSPGKAEKLAQLRGIDKWQFAGINDSYLEGRLDAKCELGHNLRYEYFAIPEELADGTQAKVRDWGGWAFRTTKGAQDDLRDRGAIVFGETCAGDFFNIAPEDMKKLVKTRKIMSDEIELTAGVITNKLEQTQELKYKFLRECLRAMGSGDAVVKVFGKKVGYTLLAFEKANIPYTKSLVILAGDQIRKDRKTFFKSVLKSCDNIVDIVLDANENDSEALNLIRDLLVYITDFTIEGDYKYDPINDTEKSRRDIGAYNKETRQNRDYTLRRLFAGTLLKEKDFESLEKITSLLKMAEEAIKVSKKAEDCVRKSELLNEKFFGEGSIRTLYPGQRYERKVRTYIVKELESFSQKMDYNNELDKALVVSESDLVYMDVMINCMSFNKELAMSNRFTSRTYEYMNRYRTRRVYETFDSMIKTFKEVMDAESIAGLIDKSIKVYEKSLIRQEEIKRAEQEEIEKERLRLEQEKARKAEEEKQRLAEVERKTREQEEKKLQEKQAKEKEDKEKEDKGKEKIETLKKLLDGYTGEEDYGIKVAKDILSRNPEYSSLSSKQKWRIDDTLNRLQGSKKEDTVVKQPNTETKKTSTNTNEKTQLKDSPEVANKVNKVLEILTGKDMKAYNKIMEASSIAFDVARTIKYKGEFSEKQLKHINKAYEKIEEMNKKDDTK